MNRKQRRAAAKEAKNDGQEDLSEKIVLFGKLGDACLVCEKPFDKKNKEMVMSWSVVVRKEEGVVRLYCPECWEKAKKIIKEVENGTTNTESNV